MWNHIEIKFAMNECMSGIKKRDCFFSSFGCSSGINTFREYPFAILPSFVVFDRAQSYTQARIYTNT